MREDFSSIYAVTDEKFNERDFNEKVAENQIKTKELKWAYFLF